MCRTICGANCSLLPPDNEILDILNLFSEFDKVKKNYANGKVCYQFLAPSVVHCPQQLHIDQYDKTCDITLGHPKVTHRHSTL